MNDIFSPKTIISFTLGALLFGTHFIIAFTEPSAAPPSNNVPTPLNTGSGGQSKAGSLILNTGGAATGLIVQSGNVGIGTINPQYLLSVGTQNNPFQVSDAGDIIVNGGSDGRWALYYPDASRGALTINSGGFGVHSNLQVDGTIRGATYGFGGFYSDADNGSAWGGYVCTNANPFTDRCSCPDGFTARQLAGGSAWNEQAGATQSWAQYYCYK